MQTPNRAPEEGAQLCPRCKKNEVGDSQSLCPGCTVEEEAEQRAGEADLETRRTAQRQEEPRQPPRRGQPTGAVRPSSGRTAHPDQVPRPADRHPNAPPEEGQRQAPPSSPPTGQRDTKPANGAAASQPANRPAPSSPPPGAGQALDQRARPAPRPAGAQPVSLAPQSGMREEPEKLVFYGPGGVGKTTLVTAIPGVVMIALESTPLLDVPRWAHDTDPPAPRTFAELLAIIRWLKTADHQHTTLAIDSADEVEAMIFRACVDRANERHEQASGDGVAENIEHVGGGYKKGYTAAVTRWRELLNGELEQLRVRRKMRIVFTAHDVITKKSNPAGDDFDQYNLNLHPEAGRSLLFNWADAVFLCNYVTQTKRQGKKGRAKGVGGRDRAMWTTNADAWIAKNRYDLPERMTMDWDALAQRIEQWRSPKLLLQAIQDMVPIVGEQLVDHQGKPYRIADIVEWELSRNPSRQKLAQLKNRLEARVAELEAERESEDDQVAARGGGDA